MFDVDWSDPNRESVGDRRARKQKKDGKGKESSTDGDSGDQDGNRTSGSVRSSVSSADKQFGFFGGGKHSSTPKKGTASSFIGKPKSAASSSQRAPTIDEQDEGFGAASTIRRVDDEQHQQQQRPLGIPHSRRFSSLADAGFAESIFSELDYNEDVPERAPGGSLFGCDTANPQPGRSTQYQELSDGISFVTKTTVTRTRERKEDDSPYLVSQVLISAGGADSQQGRFLQSSIHSSPSKHSHKSSGASATEFAEIIHRPAIPELPANPISRDDDRLSVVAESSMEEISVVPSFRPRKAKKKITHQAPAILSPSMRPIGLPDTWKAPSDWAMDPGEPAESLRSYTGSDDDEDSVDNRAAADEANGHVMDMAFLQRELARIIDCAPEEMVLYLRKEWKDPAGDETLIWASKVDWHADQHRYFLATLYHMSDAWELTEDIGQSVLGPMSQRVIALFDDEATTTYLAALNAAIPVYHISTGPVDEVVYPNVHPVSMPSITAGPFGLANGSFSCISSLQITSQFPSAEIPKLLEQIHRLLAPGGNLNTFTIDAWPLAGTAGPQLHQWLDAKLALNLEVHSRCQRPSRVFAQWLRNAGLQGDGSYTITTRFSAVPVFDGEGRGDGQYTAADAREDTVKELRSLCGRWLWKYMWMGHVDGGQCWWDVPEIVNECVQYGTTWEYRIISANKAHDQ